MKNPDVIFFDQLDQRLQGYFTSAGAKVVSFSLEDISIKITENKISYYLLDQPFEFDALFNYGHMSSFHQEAFSLLVDSCEKSGRFTLHTNEIMNILTNKLLQGFCFSRAGIKIPETFASFSSNSLKSIIKANFQHNETSIVKTLKDYAGEGIKKCDYADVAINTGAKLLWDNQLSLTQKFIPDSFGKSIRVLCIGGKPFVGAEYIDLTNDFRSNIGYHAGFEMRSLMDHNMIKEYFDLAEKTCKAIGDLTVCGVDILDSKKHGLNVLEANCWPDLYDIQMTTKLPVFETLIHTFTERAKHFKENFLKLHKKKFLI